MTTDSFSRAVVQPGDTLASICVRHGQTPSAAAELLAHNPALRMQRAGLAGPGDEISVRLAPGLTLTLPRSFQVGVGATPAQTLAIAEQIADSQLYSAYGYDAVYRFFVQSNIKEFLAAIQQDIPGQNLGQAVPPALSFLYGLASQFGLETGPQISWRSMNWAVSPEMWIWLKKAKDQGSIDWARVSAEAVAPALSVFDTVLGHTPSQPWMNRELAPGYPYEPDSPSATRPAGAVKSSLYQPAYAFEGWGSPLARILWDAIEPQKIPFAAIPFQYLQVPSALTTDALIQAIKVAQNTLAQTRGRPAIFAQGTTSAFPTAAPSYADVYATLTPDQQKALNADLSNLLKGSSLTPDQARAQLLAVAIGYQTDNLIAGAFPGGGASLAVFQNPGSQILPFGPIGPGGQPVTVLPAGSLASQQAQANISRAIQNTIASRGQIVRIPGAGGRDVIVRGPDGRNVVVRGTGSGTPGAASSPRASFPYGVDAGGLPFYTFPDQSVSSDLKVVACAAAFGAVPAPQNPYLLLAPGQTANGLLPSGDSRSIGARCIANPALRPAPTQQIAKLQHDKVVREATNPPDTTGGASASSSKGPLVVAGLIAATAVGIFYLASKGHATAGHRAAPSKPAARSSRSSRGRSTRRP